MNVYITGDQTSGFSTHVSPPIFTLNCDDPDMIFCDDEDEYLRVFTYSPFQIRTENDGEEQVTKGKLQSLHENIDQLLQSTNASSTDDYAKAAVESLFKRIMKQHSASIETSNKAVVDFVEVCKSTT